MQHHAAVELRRSAPVRAGANVDLFLRILDERETREGEEAEAVGAEFTLSLEAPYRWQDWAAPSGPKRAELQNSALGAFFGFVNSELIPHLRKLRERPNATSRQKVISEILSGVERTRIDTERNLLDILDKVHEISADNVDTTVRAVQAGKAEIEDTALQKALHGAGDCRPQRAVDLLEEDLVAPLELLPVVVQTAVEGGILRMTGAIDAELGSHTRL